MVFLKFTRNLSKKSFRNFLDKNINILFKNRYLDISNGKKIKLSRENHGCQNEYPTKSTLIFKSFQYLLRISY